MLQYFPLSPKTRPELKFRANSKSPLKWTGDKYLVHFSGLILLAVRFKSLAD